MCSILNCRNNNPPGAEEGAYTCRACGERILKGESYYKVGASFFHRECLLECYDKEELLLLLGAIPRVATKASLACVFVGVRNEK